jgi:hypothetical protein
MNNPEICLDLMEETLPPLKWVLPLKREDHPNPEILQKFI